MTTIPVGAFVDAFTVEVPATTANLGPGFDTFGLALNLKNRFHLSIQPSGNPDRIDIHKATCVDMDGVSLKAEDNLFMTSMDTVFQRMNKPRPPVYLSIEAHIPLARGLGSSSSVIVAGVEAANHILGNVFSPLESVQIAHELEGHPDNVAPALLGGAVLCDVSEYNQVQCFPIPWPGGWKVIVVVPSYRLLTETARAVLPKTLSVADAIFNLRKSSLLTYALLQGNEAAFRGALEDKLHQPYRGPLIEEFQIIRTHAQEAGAFGTVISGAGPSIAVFSPSKKQSDVLDALNALKNEQKADWRVLQLAPTTSGTCVIPQKAAQS